MHSDDDVRVVCQFLRARLNEDRSQVIEEVNFASRADWRSIRVVSLAETLRAIIEYLYVPAMRDQSSYRVLCRLTLPWANHPDWKPDWGSRTEASRNNWGSRG